MIVSMRSFIIIMLLLSSSFLYCQNYDYEPFFAVKVIDNEDSEFFFSDMRYFDSNKELKYFFWIRRGSELGTATYQLDFKKISKITFIGLYDSPLADYTPAEIRLTSGEVFEVLVNSSGYIGGIDRDFGVYGDIYMNYNIIQSIEFVHDGTFKECPFCGALFYESELTQCSFDGTVLIDQHSPQ